METLREFYFIKVVFLGKRIGLGGSGCGSFLIIVVAGKQEDE